MLLAHCTVEMAQTIMRCLGGFGLLIHGQCCRCTCASCEPHLGALHSEFSRQPAEHRQARIVHLRAAEKLSGCAGLLPSACRWRAIPLYAAASVTGRSPPQVRERSCRPDQRGSEFLCISRLGCFRARCLQAFWEPLTDATKVVHLVHGSKLSCGECSAGLDVWQLSLLERPLRRLKLSARLRASLDCLRTPGMSG